ncbi:MAG: hypothetical protein IH942_07730, partial [Acidobacteria bacterium]|nr:hypothetical protein [Acidobacteriota bacterium]
MSAIERLERANPVPDEDRLLAAPGAMDAFVSSVKERSGIVKKTDKTGAGVEDRPPIEVPTGSGPGEVVAVEGSRRRFGLVAAAAVVVLVIGAAAAILTLSGDGGDDVVAASPTTSGPITSFDDIAGRIYVSQGIGEDQYLYFLEDGTINGSTNPDLVVDRASDVRTTRFDGTQVFITTTSSRCPQPDQGGTYEIHLLENGNIQFLAIDE